MQREMYKSTCLHAEHMMLNQPFQSVEIRSLLGLEKFFVINQDRGAIVMIYGHILNQKGTRLRVKRYIYLKLMGTKIKYDIVKL